MKRAFSIYLTSVLILCAAIGNAIDTSSFYKALSSGDEASLDKALAGLEAEEKTSKTKAYIGALTMKKAGYAKGVKQKANTFKKGAYMLDEEIKANPSNAEYRFLRLTIQEHAPKILKYNKEINEDKEAVVSSYGKLNPELKKVIADYAKESKVLKPTDLK